MQHAIIAGAGIEPVETSTPPTAAPVMPAAKVSAPTTPHYSGATVHRYNHDFMPPHRSGNAAVRESWDLLTRRVRWLVDNNFAIHRTIAKLVELVVGDGITCYFGGIDARQPGDDPAAILNSPLFRFGEESDGRYERWADKYADVRRRRTLYELQATSATDLFSTGNSLWLKVIRPTPDRVCPIAWQLLEAEQLDDSQDRPEGPKQTRIERGIEYNRYGEPIAYWLYDAHPYHDLAVGLNARSRRIPANRVIHLALTTRASQDFGISMANILMQPAKDEDWLTGHELTSAAIAAGLTIAIKEAEEADGSYSFDTDAAAVSPPAGYEGDTTAGLPTVAEVGLGAGTIARLAADESIDVIETKNRPNLDVAAFSNFLLNRMSMAAGVSFHRFTGNPSGASFATLRAMINDDRAMSGPITNAVGQKIARRPRESHDGLVAALGWFESVDAITYGSRVADYQDWDILGPPLRHLNPTEDVTAARMRIASGMSTLRRECGLLNIPYRRVLRQLAVERDLARALQLSLDFSNGGGQAQSRTTTDAAGGDAES